jgi:hypothetical protein
MLKFISPVVSKSSSQSLQLASCSPSPSRLSADDERGPKDNEIAISQSAVLLLSIGGKAGS